MSVKFLFCSQVTIDKKKIKRDTGTKSIFLSRDNSLEIHYAFLNSSRTVIIHIFFRFYL